MAPAAPLKEVQGPGLKPEPTRSPKARRYTAVDKSMLTGGNLPAEPIILMHRWHVCCDRNDVGGMSDEEFLQCLHDLGSFGTVQEFRAVYSEVSSKLLEGSTGPFKLRIFKEDIKPIREDKSNEGGGKWVIRCPNSRDRLRSLWFDVVVSLVGASIPSLPHVCGCILSHHDTKRGDHVQIWTRASANEFRKEIRSQLRSVFNLDDEVSIQYHRHPNHQAQREATAQKARGDLRMRKRLESPSFGHPPSPIMGSWPMYMQQPMPLQSVSCPSTPTLTQPNLSPHFMSPVTGYNSMSPYYNDWIVSPVMANQSFEQQVVMPGYYPTVPMVDFYQQHAYTSPMPKARYLSPHASSRHRMKFHNHSPHTDRGCWKRTLAQSSTTATSAPSSPAPEIQTAPLTPLIAHNSKDPLAKHRRNSKEAQQILVDQIPTKPNAKAQDVADRLAKLSMIGTDSTKSYTSHLSVHSPSISNTIEAESSESSPPSSSSLSLSPSSKHGQQTSGTSWGQPYVPNGDVNHQPANVRSCCTVKAISTVATPAHHQTVTDTG